MNRYALIAIIVACFAVMMIAALVKDCVEHSYDKREKCVEVTHDINGCRALFPTGD